MGLLLGVMEPVGVPLGVILALGVPLGDVEGVPLPLGVWEGIGELVGVGAATIVTLRLTSSNARLVALNRCSGPPAGRVMDADVRYAYRGGGGDASDVT